ncbi:hypothetical protein [Actinocorallia populi]|uniref:hypothetical protein n=1 Tax=Actinocorallia populi TaxID=2079200 RepID=UPI001300260E|nr:hypothetical protein [Actinocorallia populi]
MRAVMSLPLATGRMYLEFRPGTSGPWKRVRRFPVHAYAPDFGAFRHDEPGYWRLHYPGDEYWGDSSSPVYHRYKSSRFTGMKVSKKRAGTGERLTFSGRLLQVGATGGKSPYKRVRVLLGYTCDRNKKLKIYPIAYVRTDRKGRFKRKVAFQCAGTFAAARFGTAYEAYSPFIKVKRR